MACFRIFEKMGLFSTYFKKLGQPRKKPKKIQFPRKEWDYILTKLSYSTGRYVMSEHLAAAAHQLFFPSNQFHENIHPGPPLPLLTKNHIDAPSWKHISTLLCWLAYPFLSVIFLSFVYISCNPGRMDTLWESKTAAKAVTQGNAVDARLGFFYIQFKNVYIPKSIILLVSW